VGQKIKVALNITVEVDAEGWEMDYGVAGTQAIREDAKRYIHSLINESADGNMTVVKS
jgi:hypothetical protein